MNKVLSLFIVSTITLLIFQSDFSTSSSGTPPNARTGAPGESNCSGCHSGAQNPITGTNSISLNFDGGNNTYLPGQTYNVSVSLTDASKVRFGFSTTVLDPSNQAVGNFIVTNTSNTSTGNSGGRQYMRHRSANATQSWDFQWQAPASSQGDVKFYIAGVAANSAGGSSGDNVYLNEFTITSATPPPAPTVDFFVDKDSSCVNTEFIFTDNSQGSITDRSWTFGSGATPSNATGSGPHLVTYSTIGPKTVELSITSTQGVFTKDSIIQVYPQVNISVSDDTSFILSDLNAGFTFPLFASGASDFSWSPSIGLSNTQIANPVFDPFAISFQSADTQIVYTITGVDSFGVCSDIQSVKINLNKPDATTGISFVDSENLKVFPNPVNDFLKIETSNQLESLRLFNVEGKSVFEQDGDRSREIVINRDDEWGTGLYFIEIQLEDGSLHTRKLIFK